MHARRRPYYVHSNNICTHFSLWLLLAAALWRLSECKTTKLASLLSDCTCRVSTRECVFYTQISISPTTAGSPHTNCTNEKDTPNNLKLHKSPIILLVATRHGTLKTEELSVYLIALLNS